MAFIYDIPPNPGFVIQGKILGNIWEHRPLHPPVEIPEGSFIEVDSVHHPLMIVMTAVCDLEQDFRKRFPGDASQRDYSSPHLDESDPHLVPHILLCEVFKEEKIRQPSMGRELWRRVSQNQDERYHHLPVGDIGNPAVDQLPNLYLDFKKTIALPTSSLYEGLRGGQVRRVAVFPAVFIHDLMHRFYGFLSRVGLPTV